MSEADSKTLAMGTAHMSAATHAYYSGRNSIGDDGKVYYANPYTVAELVKAFNDGVRSIRAELRLNADTEWD